MNWEEIKEKGSTHYKTGSIEPIDLIKEGGMLWDFALASIIKYAYRCRESETVGKLYVLNLEGSKEIFEKAKKDLDKIIHYAEMLKCCVEEGVKNDRRYINLNTQTNAATEEIRQQLQRVSTKRRDLGTKSNRRRT